MGVVFMEPWAQQFYAEIPDPEPIARMDVEVLGVSRLTVDPLGVEIWLDMASVVERITGKKLRHKHNPDSWFRNDPTEFVLPEGDVESVMHELCHWIVASDDQRKLRNLGIGKLSRADGLWTEERVWAIESWLFSPFINELELALLINPNAHIRPDSKWVHDPMEVLAYALERARSISLPVTVLRSVLGRWLEWERLAGPPDAGDQPYQPVTSSAAPPIRLWAE